MTQSIRRILLIASAFAVAAPAAAPAQAPAYVVFSDEGHGFLKKHNNDLRREVETLFLRRLFGTQ